MSGLCTTYHKWPRNLVNKEQEVKQPFKLGVTPAGNLAMLEQSPEKQGQAAEHRIHLLAFCDRNS